MERDSNSSYTSRPPASDEQKKGSFFFFGNDQGEGWARVAVIILKLAEIALTTIYALCLGVFAPIILWTGEDAELFSDNPALVLWFISSIIYIIGMFVVMLGHSKTASVIHTIAFIGTLVTYSCFSKLYADIPDSRGPSELYMPCLFIFVITVFIMLLINVPKWIRMRIVEETSAAPSVLGGEYTAKTPVKEPVKKPLGKRKKKSKK